MKTTRHPMDHNRRLPGRDKIYHLPICATCGNLTIPFFDQPNKAHCAMCGEVALCRVPETHVLEVRETIAVLDQPPASVQVDLAYGQRDLYDLDGREFLDLKRTEEDARW